MTGWSTALCHPSFWDRTGRGLVRDRPSSSAVSRQPPVWVLSGAGELAVTSYFGAYQIREHQPQVAVSSLRELPCPVLQSRELGGQPDASCGALELFDWLGAVCCDASLCVCRPPTWVSGGMPAKPRVPWR